MSGSHTKWIFLLSLGLLTSCINSEVPQTELEFESRVDYKSVPSRSVSFEEVRQGVLLQKCISCHAVGGERSNSRFDLPSEESFISAGWIIPGDPRRSPLFNRLKGAEMSVAPENMPSGTDLTQNELLLIRDWIITLGQNDRAPGGEINSNEPIEFQRMMGNMVENCFTCHAEGQREFRTDTNFFVDRTWTEREFIERYVNLIRPGNSSESELTYRLLHNNSSSGSGVIKMPMGPTAENFNIQDYQVYERWINSIEARYVPNIQIENELVYINANTESVELTCTVNLPVVISYNRNPVLNTNCDSGSVVIPNSLIPGSEGVYMFDVSQTSNLFSLNDNVTLEIHRDLVAPALSVISPSQGQTVLNNVLIQGECESGLNISFRGDVASDSELNCSGGLFSYSLDLSVNYGEKNLIISQMDLAGNETQINLSLLAAQFISGPDLTIDNNIVTSTQENFVISGTCENNLEITVQGASGALTCLGERYSGTLSLDGADRVVVVTLSQTDNQNQTTNITHAITKDTIAPVNSFANITDQQIVGSSTSYVINCESGLPLIRTLSTEGNQISSGSLNCSATGIFTDTINFPADGAYIIGVTQTDNAGNSNVISININSDQTPPNLVVSTPVANSTVMNNFTLNGECESGNTVNLSFGGQSLQGNCDNSQFSFSAIQMEASFGSTNIVLTQQDQFENETQIFHNLNFQPLLEFSTDFERARYVLESNCLECHSSSNASTYGNFINMRAGMTEEEYLSSYPLLIIPGNSSTSSLITRMVSAGGNMPPNLNTFPTELHQAVTTWIDGLEVMNNDQCEDITPEIATLPVRALTPNEIFNVVEDIFSLSLSDTERIEINLSISEKNGRYNTQLDTSLIPNLSSDENLFDELSPGLLRMVDQVFENFNDGNFQNIHFGRTGCSFSTIATNETCRRNYFQSTLAKGLKRSLAQNDPLMTDVETSYNFFISENGNPRESFVRSVATVMFFSPDFLFHSYRGILNSDGDYELTNEEIAHKISFLFWGSIPNDQMLTVDWRSILANPDNTALTNELLNLFQAERLSHFVTHFLKEWLHLDQDMTALLLGTSYEPRTEEFIYATKMESEYFIRHLLVNNRPVNEIVTADYTFLNNSLLDYYQVSNLSLNSNFQQVLYSNVPGLQNRRGLLSQATFLTLGSRPNKPGTIQRGVAALTQIACYQMGAPSGEPAELTNIDRTMHTESELFRLVTEAEGSACVSCHRSINPFGYPFEVFDRLGRHPASLANSNGSLPEYLVYTDIGIENNPNANGSIPKAETFFLDERGGDVDFLTNHGLQIDGNYMDHLGLIELVSNVGAVDHCLTDNLYDYSIGIEAERGVAPSRPERAGTHLSQTCNKRRALDSSTGLRDLILNLLRLDEFSKVRRN